MGLIHFIHQLVKKNEKMKKNVLHISSVKGGTEAVRSVVLPKVVGLVVGRR